MDAENKDFAKDRLDQLLRISEGQRRVAVIGAGTSGLIVSQKLIETGLFPIVFEKAGDTGGVWALKGHPAMYPGLIMNTSPQLTIFKNTPQPIPDQSLHYSAKIYTNYIHDHFAKTKVHEHIVTHAEIKKCEINSDGGGHLWWSPPNSNTISSRLYFEYIVYAGGVCQKASLPSPKALEKYKGPIFHSSERDDLHSLLPKKLLIVGAGNTASDLASHLNKKGISVDISARNTTWFLPRSIQNIPIDEFVGALKRAAGTGYKSEILLSIEPNKLFCTSSSNRKKVDFLHQRITINDDVPTLLNNGQIRIKGEPINSEEFEISFCDGSKERYDAVINCTGYEVDFNSYIAQPHAHHAAGVKALALPGWWFIGSPAIWGGSPALAEWQAEIIASGIKHQLSSEKIFDIVRRAGNYERSLTCSPFGLTPIDFHDYAAFASKIIDQIHIL